ncbi:54S ribosomal protein L3 mitochondrial [Ceratocystis pirilliformis]|uniref:Large ribosomal subunit protein mL44 n=1 Tax=Ceratocystis pirilliformis TaxID=259994 RepID=A0ABR3ZH88_9PEZI
MMKRLRVRQLAGQLASVAPSPAVRCMTSEVISQHVRFQSSTTPPPAGNSAPLHAPVSAPTTAADPVSVSEANTASQATLPSFEDIRPVIGANAGGVSPDATSPYPSPPPSAALKSAKLHALHARLGLSEKFPINTLARALVDPSADENPKFNNVNLAYLGSTVINYHLSEFLVCKYPRLPMLVLYEVIRGYSGSEALSMVARQWGVESASEPGGEVDPGLMQFSTDPAKGIKQRVWGHVRKEAAYAEKYNWRRSVSSRTVLDDAFGDALSSKKSEGTPAVSEAGKLPSEIVKEQRQRWMRARAEAMSGFVQALVGGIYIHRGREAAKTFVRIHLLSRTLPVEKMFAFRLPTMELTKLCAREGFEPPVARMESETGRLSRTPVFVVGIYSGTDKLGEGIGSSQDEARQKAAMNALKAWYLYSPGENVRVPSDMYNKSSGPWAAPYIDIGEIV